MHAPTRRPLHRPFAAALNDLGPAAPAAEPPLPPLRVLPKLLDFTGSVSLAGALQSPLVHPRREAVDEPLLIQDLEGRLYGLERRLEPVFSGTLPISSHLRMARELKSPGPSMDGTHPGVRAIRAPFTRYAQGNLFDVTSSLATLRLDLGPRIAGLSDEAARLEALDTALREATSRERDVLLARLLTRIDAAFAEDAKAALQALPLKYTPAHLEPWFLPGGWVPRYLARTGAVLKGLFWHEAALISALARSATLRRTS